MKTKYLVLIGVLLALTVILSGCATGLTASSWPGVTADDQKAYIAGGPFVYAVNLETGAEAWRFPEKASAASPFFAAPVLTADGQLIVGGFDHKLHSVNPQTGAENWQFSEARSRFIGSALLLGDMIYAPNADYNLYAVTMLGKLQWVFKADQSIWGTPVTDGTNLYFGTLGRKVYAVNAATGTEVWKQTVEGAVLGSPVLGSNGLLYVATYSGSLYALDPATGNTRWQKTASSWIWSAPALDGSSLYFGDGQGTFYSFDADTGTQNWSLPLNGTILNTPLISDGKIVIGTEAGNLYTLSLDGTIISTGSVDGKIYAPPVAAGALILVAPTGGAASLVALDSAGATKWSFTPAK
jgi:eukaryotic-like serine/threonine-protein kinase